jgi:predicted DsbA family dithiol-disulfide isomerase
VDAVVWSDYLCPWCYVGLDRTALLERLGISVTPRPYELHPHIPPTGLPLTEGKGRRLYDRIAQECEEVGLPFRRPDRIPSSRLALETAEWVRVNRPEQLRDLHLALFRAVFVDGADIGDPSVIAELAPDAGRRPDLVDEARAEAIDAGVTGTPSWLIDGRLVLSGIQPAEQMERMVRRMQDKTARA